jgi:hypothetical protein
MKACPLAFEHPSQAQQLNGLGPKLCDRLTEKLKAYCQENGLPAPQVPGQGVRWPHPFAKACELTSIHRQQKDIRYRCC